MKTLFSVINKFFLLRNRLLMNDQHLHLLQADALKHLGLDELGYVFMTIDDNWSLPERDNVTGIAIHNLIILYHHVLTNFTSS